MLPHLGLDQGELRARSRDVKEPNPASPPAFERATGSKMVVELANNSWRDLEVVVKHESKVERMAGQTTVELESDIVAVTRVRCPIHLHLAGGVVELRDYLGKDLCLMSSEYEALYR